MVVDGSCISKLCEVILLYYLDHIDNFPNFLLLKQKFSPDQTRSHIGTLNREMEFSAYSLINTVKE